MIALLLNHLWQSSLCVGGSALVALALRRNGANVRFWLWFAASIKFLVPFAALTALGAYSLTPMLPTVSAPSVTLVEPPKEKLDFSPEIRAPQSPDIPKDDPDQQIYFRKYSALSFEGVTIANPLIIVRPIQFGGRDDPVLLASRAQHASDSMNRLAPDIIIGMEILQHLHLYYATNEQKLYITPAGSG